MVRLRADAGLLAPPRPGCWARVYDYKAAGSVVKRTAVPHELFAQHPVDDHLAEFRGQAGEIGAEAGHTHH